MGAKGVYFYRPQFLIKVQALAEKYQVHIFADEILTGGGRTGKFFAFQHNEGFQRTRSSDSRYPTRNNVEILASLEKNRN
ncbi:MAG: aminotransferase class III-fold pyridoxal phosphate-dependent enzyme [Pseudobdellovibrionaceae bacterium]